MLYIEKEDCGGGPVITKAKVVIIMRIVNADGADDMGGIKTP